MLPGTVGSELACSNCHVVLQISHNPEDDLPKHRCANGRAEAFDLVLHMDAPVEDSKRVDRFWYGEYSDRIY